MSEHDVTTNYSSIDEFYAASDDRRLSPEVDFGSHWTDMASRPANWRVAWIDRTGEVYAVRLNSGEVRVLGVAPTREQVEGTLRGWTRDAGRTLVWVSDRLAKPLPPAPDPAPDPAPPQVSGYYGDPENGTIRFFDARHGTSRVLSASPLARQKSPDGFAWGYGGSGPAAAAASVLYDYFGREASATLIHGFKDTFIATVDMDDQLVIPLDVIERWVSAQAAGPAAAQSAEPESSAPALRGPRIS